MKPLRPGPAEAGGFGTDTLKLPACVALIGVLGSPERVLVRS